MTPSPLTVADITRFLEEFAPLTLAETWDNVGLLLGDLDSPVSRVITCLTLTEDVAQEAVRTGAQVIVSHHPVLFKAVKKLTTATAEGRTLLILLKAGIAVYSPHTAFDSAAEGINRRLASQLGLSDPRALRPSPGTEFGEAGGGRFGELEEPIPLREFLRVVRDSLNLPVVSYTGDPERMIRRAAVACGSAAEFLDDAVKSECDALVTGEARFHACLEARAKGIALVLAGHYATERPAVEQLAERLAERFPGLTATASQNETDPVQWSLS